MVVNAVGEWPSAFGNGWTETWFPFATISFDPSAGTAQTLAAMPAEVQVTPESTDV